MKSWMKIFYLILLGIFVNFGNPLRAQSNSDSTEVGVVEHLGSTIPLDLTFKNEQNQIIRLGDIITKPTILTLVYFDCPGLCSPLLTEFPT